MAKLKQIITPPAIQTRYTLRCLNLPPYPVTIAGRLINDTQIIFLPRDQKFLDQMDAAGYQHELRRA